MYDINMAEKYSENKNKRLKALIEEYKKDINQKSKKYKTYPLYMKFLKELGLFSIFFIFSPKFNVFFVSIALFSCFEHVNIIFV